MPFTNADYLPTYEQLDVQEINMSAAPLRAGSHHFGKYCDNQSKEFMLCNQEEKDPRKCLEEGKAVTRCGLHFFQKVKQHCGKEFTEYWNCLDHADWDMFYPKCRKTQAVFDTCMKEKFNQERPELGFFSRTRVHETSRPRPIRNIPLPDHLRGPEDIDKSGPEPETAKLGSNIMFNT